MRGYLAQVFLSLRPVSAAIADTCLGSIHVPNATTHKPNAFNLPPH
jgi:hypothetical protein